MTARAPAISSGLRRDRMAPLRFVSTCLPGSAWALLFFSRHATAMIVTARDRLRKHTCGCVSGASGVENVEIIHPIGGFSTAGGQSSLMLLWTVRRKSGAGSYEQTLGRGSVTFGDGGACGCC